MKMYNPVATYRIQFHKGFNFDDFENIILYLKELGVKTVYASPIFEATAGSQHGYDSINPHKINPEIGTEEQLKSIKGKLQQAGIGWLQDIVPNHMAFDSNNSILRDVLEKGPQSEYADFFDIDWNSSVYNGHVMVPFLGSSLEEVIQNGELKITKENERYVFKYYNSSYPLNETTQKEVMGREQEINSNPALLKDIAEKQHYRLCNWQETDKQINYRRFFTINGLICVNIQSKKAFDYYHQKIKKLIDEKVFDGLRIDHIDGLYNPTKYLQDLNALTGGDTYITVEKILERKEGLPSYWPVQGTTGYDFLAIVNNLFTNKAAEKEFTKFYEKLTQDRTSIHRQLRDKKAFILYNHMAGELNNLYQLFIESDLVSAEELQSITEEKLKKSIGEFLIQCPVYRFYGNAMPLNKKETEAVRDICRRIKDNYKELAAGAALLEQVLVENPIKAPEDYNKKALHFYQRLMQFTGPLMAKGFEDTLMYTYNRFIGHNDVGDSPEAFGISVEEFHKSMIERQEQWPLTINTTSTHDTKRGEDVRARLNVLTDIQDEWIALVKRWMQINSSLKINNAPNANDEYFIYQSLIGAYLMPEEDDTDLEERLQQYIQKVLREGKTNSDWASPNEAYEKATGQFISALLDKNSMFWKSFQDFHNKIADYGIVNSLSQTLIKFTCSGIPDIYQGTELWDLSFVDPDNRHPVDYTKRKKLLENIVNNKSEVRIKQLWQERHNGTVKLWLTHMLLKARTEHPDVFTKGAYIPLQIKGKYKRNIIAFARKHEGTWYITVAPLHLAQICKESQEEILQKDWKDTRIILPEGVPTEWQHVFTKQKGSTAEELHIKDIFSELPVALLKLQKKNSERSAGILLHITSLPSSFGIGDFGSGAKQFIDFLKRAGQKYWQILPLNPTSAGSGNSPYSSISAMAGNTLLISPELLVEDGLISKKEIEKYQLSDTDKADFEQAAAIKEELCDIAYENFLRNSALHQEFNSFCHQESYWLNDFATYLILKKQQERKPWHEWPDEYKNRDKEALKAFTEQHNQSIEKTKWLQFIFAEQWKKLKDYCNKHEIHIFGDLPFYVSHDSADVWSHREIFCLDENGHMSGVAGTPPDYFSKDGQLWGMPTFNWNELKERNYDWWIGRLRKNLQVFDLLRIDHFRAFEAYWQVPAEDKTAINGKWIKGPGTDFFDVVSKHLGGLPFVAEDLGSEMDDVYVLRDKINLPGMKVLQFAFGENMRESIDIPHSYNRNCIVYTGTHDNNTTVGWFREEIAEADKKRLKLYTGHSVKEKNVADVLARLAYASVANTVIVPMQDILGLDETARMNTPGKNESNWLWRLKPGQLNKKNAEQLKEWTIAYNRL